MELETQILAVERGRDLLEEVAVGVKPRHLILVLVGHQLEQIARDRFREPASSGRLGCFRRFDLFNQRTVARRIT